jgi:hypothetical protein
MAKRMRIDYFDDSYNRIHHTPERMPKPFFQVSVQECSFEPNSFYVEFTSVGFRLLIEDLVSFLEKKKKRYELKLSKNALEEIGPEGEGLLEETIRVHNEWVTPRANPKIFRAVLEKARRYD